MIGTPIVNYSILHSIYFVANRAQENVPDRQAKRKKKEVIEEDIDSDGGSNICFGIFGTISHLANTVWQHVRRFFGGDDDD